MTDSTAAIASDSSPRFPTVTTRVGLVFVALAVTLLACATLDRGWITDLSMRSMSWVIALVACSISALLAMGSVRNLRTIELELRRCSPGKRVSETSRAIVSKDPVAQGWNQLLHEASDTSDTDTENRSAADLDHEVITLARAMRGLPVAWIVSDLDGAVRFLSPAARHLLSLNEQQSGEGLDLLDLLGLRDDTSEEASHELLRLLSPIRMVHSRLTLETEDRTLHLRVTRSRLGGRARDGEGLAWVLDDVTQQKLATEARDGFLMTATHELRTPLTNLQAYAEALLDEEELEIEKQKEFCNVINSEAIRLGRLVDQLLTVSQMEAGSMIANRHELELLPMLEYAIDHIRGQADKKAMELVTNLTAKLPVTFGDRDKLQAALTNLLGNAVKYTPEGGKVVLRCAADERWIRVDVEDNGPGISEEEQGQVFEKFYRGRSQGNHPGNGLGLAFSREIARLHGGDIELKSALGEGSTFTLVLPVAGRSRSGL